MRTLSMLPPASPITLAIGPKFLAHEGVTLTRAGNRWGGSVSTSQVTSIHPSCSYSRRRGEWDLEDADAFAGDHDADDAVAGTAPPRLERDGQVSLTPRMARPLRWTPFCPVSPRNFRLMTRSMLNQPSCRGPGEAPRAPIGRLFSFSTASE